MKKNIIYTKKNSASAKAELRRKRFYKDLDLRLSNCQKRIRFWNNNCRRDSENC